MPTLCEGKCVTKPPFGTLSKKAQILIQRRSAFKTKPRLREAAEFQFVRSRRQLFRTEWNRMQEVVRELYRSFERMIRGPGDHPPVLMHDLIAAHNDVHILLNSNFGPFLFDFVEQKILPEGAKIIFDAVLEISRQERENPVHVLEPFDEEVKRNFNLELLALAWRHFYVDVLPVVETVFLDISGPSFMSIRLAAILAFRDVVVQSVADDLFEILQNPSDVEGQIGYLRQMILSIKNAAESCPIPECTFDFDRLVPLVMLSNLPFITDEDAQIEIEDSNSYHGNSDDENYSLPFQTVTSREAESLNILTITSDTSLNYAYMADEIAPEQNADDEAGAFEANELPLDLQVGGEAPENDGSADAYVTNELPPENDGSVDAYVPADVPPQHILNDNSNELRSTTESSNE